jgi:alkyldihydroxyacetonephosphate synthase
MTLPDSTRPGLAELRVELERIVGPAHVSSTPTDRVAYARDLWPRQILAVRGGDPAPFPPDAIVWPATARQVSQVVKSCATHGFPVLPFGAGSGVCGGTTCVGGGIIVDTKRLDQVHQVDLEAGTVHCDPGLIGQHLEDHLNRRGATLGHFPSSIYCSTVGGWLAARSAGQMSTRYGKIEDLVIDLELCDGTGTLRSTPWSAAGLDWTQAIVGSEGTLGLITRSTLRIHPMPAARHFRGFSFGDVGAGMHAIRQLLQAGYAPAVVRLYDELDTQLARVVKGESGQSARTVARLLSPLGELGHALERQVMREALSRPLLLQKLLALVPMLSPGGVLLIVGWEGAERRTRAVAEAGIAFLRSLGGDDLGAAPGERWFEHRYGVSYRQSPIFDSGAFCDTMEVASTWDRLEDLYRGVHRALSRHAVVLAHFSHAYPEGCSIYFTVAAAAGSQRESEERYDALWRDGMEAVLAAGGTISHHHGVGLSKAGFMPREHGAGGFGVLAGLKRVLDPPGIMNPTKLGLGRLP